MAYHVKSECAYTELQFVPVGTDVVSGSASAAAQAITFFIRSHLHRCEVEEDFPLLLRHVLSGTPKDDALAPALYSRSGGNISKQQKDENGKDVVERKTAFRRGTTVWYLSKAAGAPCPFARCGIALRDFSEVSAITGAESRKGSGAGKRNDVSGEPSRGLKRKREREGLRRRTTIGTAVTQYADEEEEVEGRKPPKIKLTLRLRPCLTSMREKSEPAESSSSEFESDSDSDSDSNDGSMSVEEGVQAEHIIVPTQESSRKQVQTTEPSWTFPPYPIHRRISIPPYTPCEESCPTFLTSSSADWLPVKTEPTSMDPSTSGASYIRAASVAFSVASPPPESDMEDEFGADDYEEDFSFSFSDNIKSEDDAFAYVWPKAAPSTTHSGEVMVKTEPDYDDCGVGTSKRDSTQTLTGIKTEDLPYYELQALSLAFDAGTNTSELSLRSSFDFKQEESAEDDGVLTWEQPVDITPMNESVQDSELTLAWKDIELLGPESLNLQELELCEMNNTDAIRRLSPSPQLVHEAKTTGDAPEVGDVVFSHCGPTFSEPGPSPPSPFVSPASLDDIVPSWSAGSLSSLSSGEPETDLESLAPTSPSPYYDPESPTIVRDNSVEEDHLFSFIRDGMLDKREVIDKPAPWAIPGSSRIRGISSHQRQRPAIDDISVSEASTPWERGMVSQDDVEERLLPLLSPLPDDNSGRMPAPSQMAVEYSNSPPLSPQEAEIFQSFCLVADNEPESAEAKDGQSHLSEVFSASLFAASSRPRMSRSSSSKRTTKFDSKRMSLEKTEQDGPEYPADDDANAEANSRKKNANLPLRRSKRVAKQSAREKLRKRT